MTIQKKDFLPILIGTDLTGRYSAIHRLPCIYNHF